MVHRSNYIQLLLIAGLAAAAVLVPVLSSSWVLTEDPLLRVLSQARIGGGRFFSAPASQFDPVGYEQAVTNATVYLLSASDSTADQRLRALIEAGKGRLHEAAQILQVLAEEHPESAAILNDLGVVYLGLGEDNAINYFKAAALFDRSAKTAPRSPVPHYNAAVALQKAQLYEWAEREFGQHQRLVSQSLWKKNFHRQPLRLMRH